MADGHNKDSLFSRYAKVLGLNSNYKITTTDNNVHRDQWGVAQTLVSEGEIEGLVNGLESILFNGSPIHDGTKYLYENTYAELKTGTRDQSAISYLNGVPGVSYVYGGGEDLQWHADFVPNTADFSSVVGASSTVITSSTHFGITEQQATAVDKLKMTIEFPTGLERINNEGKHKVTIALFVVEFRYQTTTGGPWYTKRLLGGATGEYPDWPVGSGWKKPVKSQPNTPFNGGIINTDRPSKTEHGAVYGNTQGSFAADWEFDISSYGAINWELHIKRATPHKKDYMAIISTGNTLLLTARLKSVEAQILEKFSYPYCAYSTFSFQAKDFPAPPHVSFHVRGKKVKVPSNYTTREEVDSVDPLSQAAVYTGLWDGTFKSTLTYTNNPAWVLYDILTNNIYGMGDFIQESDIDIYSLYKIAKYCDELVPNGLGGEEPRFVCNVYLSTATEAYKVIKDLCSVFRGMMVWMDGQLTAIQDSPKEPVYTFTAGNVIDGNFNYEYTGRRARPNRVNVSYNSPQEQYKQTIITVDDTDNILEKGEIISADIIAFGCTSEGQARRAAFWYLLTAQLETEIVSFSTSVNASFVRPGDLVKIQDNYNSQIEFSGRLTTGSTTTTIELDRNVTLQSGQAYYLYIIVPEPGCYLQQDEATISAVTYYRGDLIPGITTAEAAATLLDDSSDQVSTNFSPNSRLERRDITTGAGTGATLTVSSAFSEAPTQDTVWAVSNTEEYSREDTAKTYRILGITEDSINQYSIIASIYAPEKYEELENSWTIEVDPYIPNTTLSDLVPEPTDVKAQVVIENTDNVVLVSWNAPVEDFTDSLGTTIERAYPDIAGYEVLHDMDTSSSDSSDIKNVPRTSNTLRVNGVSPGVYEIKVRAVNNLGVRSAWVETTLQLVPKGVSISGFLTEDLLVHGGSFSREMFFGYSSGIATLASDYEYISPVGQQLIVSSGTTAQTVVDFSGISSGDTVYWMYDASDTVDPWKIVDTYEDPTTTTKYWKEYGAANNGLTTITGTVAATLGRDTLAGTGTSFSTDFSDGDLIKVNSEYYEVMQVESDTSLRVRSNFSSSFSGLTAEKQSINPQPEEDAIIAKVTNTAGTFSIEKYASFLGINGLSGQLTNEAFVTVSDADGTNYNLSGSGGNFKVYYGDFDSSSEATYDVNGGSGGVKTQNGLTFTINTSTGAYSLSGASWTSDSESFTAEAVYQNLTIQKVYTISKSKTGGAGADGIDGDPGTDGANNATVTLYNKNTSSVTPPSAFSGTFTYTFATGVLSGGTLNGWTQTAPDITNGEYLWSRVATASSNTATDSVPTADFASASVVGIGGTDGADGTDGTDGANNATVTLYNKNTSGSTAPTLFSGTFTYTFATGVLSGGTLNGWAQTAPTLSNGEYLWSALATASSNTATDSVPDSDFSTPSVVGIGGANGTSTFTYYDASTSPPATPSENELWYQTDTKQLRRYDGVDWDDIVSTNGATWGTGGDITNFPVTVSAPTGLNIDFIPVYTNLTENVRPRVTWNDVTDAYAYELEYKKDSDPATITGITKANPGVVTATAHGFADGDVIKITSVSGMIEVNDKQYIVANSTTDTFELSGVNTTGYTTYTSGGSADYDYVGLANVPDNGNPSIYYDIPTGVLEDDQSYTLRIRSLNEYGAPGSWSTPLTGQSYTKGDLEASWLIVGPNAALGEYPTIQSAVTALSTRSYDGIFIKNGTYTVDEDDQIDLPQQDITIIGQALGGVILQTTGSARYFFRVQGHTTTNYYYKFENLKFEPNTSNVSITGITNANPGVITAPNHGLTNGQFIYITGCIGNTAFNDDGWVVANATTNTFSCYGSRQDTTLEDTTASGTYTSGGTITPGCDLIYVDCEGTGSNERADIYLTNCIFENSGTTRYVDSGLYYDGYSGSNNYGSITATGCVFNNLFYGFECFYTDSVLIQSSKFSGVTIGVDVTDVGTARVTQNAFKGDSTREIQSAVEARDVVKSSNILVDYNDVYFNAPNGSSVLYGIYTNVINSTCSGNTIKMINLLDNWGAWMLGIYAVNFPNGMLSNNTIEISTAESVFASDVVGIRALTLHDCAITGNSIKMDIPYNWICVGIQLWVLSTNYNLRNNITGNQINLTDSTKTNHYGIEIEAGSDDNNITQNTFSNCNTDILDGGTNNTTTPNKSV